MRGFGWFVGLGGLYAGFRPEKWQKTPYIKRLKSRQDGKKTAKIRMAILVNYSRYKALLRLCACLAGLWAWVRWMACHGRPQAEKRPERLACGQS
ncbi:MAG: hypothetical protein ACOYN4_14565 [Bacteroidales bacterium]